MAETLYIIGNGFDLHHDIPSRYEEFGRYLRRTDRNTYDIVERYFDVNAEFWAEFEENLAAFDEDTLVDDASSSLVSYGADDWSDSYHHDYQDEIQEVVDAVSSKLRLYFGDWVRQLPIPDPTAIEAIKVPIVPDSFFLNFNYTPSLQHLYGVADGCILHIHGAALDPHAKLVLGHGWKPPTKPERHQQSGEFADEYDYEDDDVRVAEGQKVIDRYFKSTFKPTAKIITDNKAFFSTLGSVKQVFVMGHSVSKVDHPYFHEVIRHIDAARVGWKFSYHGDRSAIRSQVVELGLDEALVEYAQLSEF